MNIFSKIFACLLTILQERGAYLLRPSSAVNTGSAPASSRPISPPPGGNAISSSTNRRLLNRYRFSEAPTENQSITAGGSSVARQVVCGVEALLTDDGGTVAVEVATARDWQLILGLLEVCGAGAFPITMAELEAGGIKESMRTEIDAEGVAIRRGFMCKFSCISYYFDFSRKGH